MIIIQCVQYYMCNIVCYTFIYFFFIFFVRCSINFVFLHIINGHIYYVKMLSAAVSLLLGFGRSLLLNETAGYCLCTKTILKTIFESQRSASS